MKIVFFFLGMISLTQLAWAQPTQPEHTKKTHVDSAGRYYQQAALPVLLFVAPSAEAKPVQLKSADGKPIFLEGHGVHTLRHHDVVTNSVDAYYLYADGIAPVTSIQLTDSLAQTNLKTLFKNKVAVSLKATDEMSGVEAIYYSVNSSAYQPYQPIVLGEGNYSYYYYSVDKTGNAEKPQVQTFKVDASAPKTFHNIVGISSQKVISTASTIYLTATDSMGGVAQTFYKIDKEKFKLYPGGNIAFQQLTDGEHTLTYYSVDNVGHKEAEKSVSFYFDKTAPIMSADVLGDKFLVGERVYFSGRTKLKLTAIDNKSGIKEVMYSMNNEPYQTYADPFYLPNRSGIHNVRYYAIDNTNNKANDNFAQSIGVIYLDLTGPALAHSFTGPTFVKADTVLVSQQTKITLTATDPESGLKKIAYSFDNDQNETPYTNKPLEVKRHGLHTLTIFGYDNVNNKNMKSVIFFSDSHGPEIHERFTVAAGAEGKYPSYTNIYLSATDAEVGAGEIWYTVNGGKSQLYAAPIKGFDKNKHYTLKIKALDLLGNVSEKTVEFKTDRY
ncbi:MAG: hypothetical protein J0L67_15550 [Cytophagales bacterium]|nr:hypothetical protein [Cytophagales bacterium]